MSTTDQSTVLREALKYQDALIAYAYGRLRDWSLAKDAVQDALTVLAEKYEQYNPEYGIYLWFREIVRRKTLEICRDRRREVYVEDEELSGLVDESLTECMTEREAQAYEEKLSALKECMSRLSAKIQDLLIAYHSEAEPYEILAGRMKRSVEALRTMMFRTRGELRKCMERRLRGMEGAVQ